MTDSPRANTVQLTVAACALKAVVDKVMVAPVEDAGCAGQRNWGAVGSGWHETQYRSIAVAVEEGR
jgi:hypothetical protein